MKLRYRCLILDHDDTVVDSTSTVHYPAYLECMEKLRPNLTPLDLDGWFLKNFHPGILPYLTDELCLDTGELEEEYRVWRSYSSTRQPSFYPGMIDFLLSFGEYGGKIAVVSHSERDIIERDYRVCTEGRVRPDMVFGWEMAEDKRKPSPWPVLETIRRLELSPEDILVVDDLRPAVDMAGAAGVDVAAAGWGHSIPKIRSFMKDNCKRYLHSIQELADLLLCP